MRQSGKRERGPRYKRGAYLTMRSHRRGIRPSCLWAHDCERCHLQDGSVLASSDTLRLGSAVAAFRFPPLLPQLIARLRAGPFLFVIYANERRYRSPTAPVMPVSTVMPAAAAMPADGFNTAVCRREMALGCVHGQSNGCARCQSDSSGNQKRRCHECPSIHEFVPSM